MEKHYGWVRCAVWRRCSYFVRVPLLPLWTWENSNVRRGWWWSLFQNWKERGKGIVGSKWRLSSKPRRRRCRLLLMWNRRKRRLLRIAVRMLAKENVKPLRKKRPRWKPWGKSWAYKKKTVARQNKPPVPVGAVTSTGRWTRPSRALLTAVSLAPAPILMTRLVAHTHTHTHTHTCTHRHTHTHTHTHTIFYVCMLCARVWHTHKYTHTHTHTHTPHTVVSARLRWSALVFRRRSESLWLWRLPWWLSPQEGRQVRGSTVCGRFRGTGGWGGATCLRSGKVGDIG